MNGDRMKLSIDLPLLRPRQDLMDQWFLNLNTILVTDPPGTSGGVSLDYDAVFPNIRARMDDGDLPAEWGYFWLKLCESVLNLPAKSKTWPVILKPREKKIYPLSSYDLCGEIGSNNWKSQASIFVLWGVSERYFKKLYFPVICSGCLFPFSDGCDIGWIANENEARIIGLPSDQPT